MSRKYKFRDQNQLYFITYTVINWIDLFIRNIYREILIDSWKFCMKEKGLEVYAWVIMTSHAHMIIGSHGEKMQTILQHMKQFTSQQLKKSIIEYPGESRKTWMLDMMIRAGMAKSNNKNFQLWQQDNHPMELFNLDIAYQKLNYIHNNPVKAGFVEFPHEYLYSSARDYYGKKKGLLDISLLDTLIV
jgi:putative transposase